MLWHDFSKISMPTHIESGESEVAYSPFLDPIGLFLVYLQLYTFLRLCQGFTTHILIGIL